MQRRIDQKMHGSLFWACTLLAFVVCIKVDNFSPGRACGGAIEIQTARSSGDVIDRAGCQLISYNDRTDVIPLQANLDGEWSNVHISLYFEHYFI